MYRGFNLLNINENFFGNDYEKYRNYGLACCSRFSKLANKSLKDYVRKENNLIDASALQEAWFPVFANKFDVFISHSHNDQNLAYALAGWLMQEMKLNCFVDGAIWGSADSLLYELDLFRQSNSVYFDYKERNLTNSQIHALLIDSIMQMIKDCECLFFLYTSNSIPINGESLSPWLFLEVGISRVIEKMPNIERRKSLSHKKIALESAECIFPMSLSHLIELNVKDLHLWRNSYKDSLDVIKKSNEQSSGHETLYSLDVLYDLTKPYYSILEG